MKKTIIFIFLFLLSATYLAFDAQAGIIFQENFDNQQDWTVTQSRLADSVCYTPYNGPCTPAPPANWSGYYNGISWLGNFQPGYGNGYNHMYINAIPGYPYETTGTCRGGSGKCLTFWDEAVYDGFVNSDGQLLVDLGNEYPEIYIRFYIKFGRKADGTDYAFTNSGSDFPMHKIMHLQHYLSGSPSQYFAQNEGNQPVVSGGFAAYGPVGGPGNFMNYMGYRCLGASQPNPPTEPVCAAPGCNYYCQGTPVYRYDSGCLDQVTSNSSFNNSIGDGNWHMIEYRFKMNTAAGTADGVYEFWYDGVKKDSRTKIPFNQTGAPTPLRGWRLFSIGGNNYLRFSGCSGASCEQWYAIDDIFIATEVPGKPNPPGNLRNN